MSTLDDLRALLVDLDDAELADLIATLPEPVVMALSDDLGAVSSAIPTDPLRMAEVLIPGFVARPHLAYLSARMAAAVHDVEAGKSRRLIVEMPPRTGKTTLATLATSSWIMARHPSWPLALVSHDGRLATSWGRQVRRWVEAQHLGQGVKIAPDAGAVSAWETTDGGKFLSISTRESFTGRGVRCLFIDDATKDFVDAHSMVMRDNLWDWWLSVAQTRLEPPYLVVVTQTRWSDDDLVARLLSNEYEGSPEDWERVHLPALAEADDSLGRLEGAPLLSPLLNEDEGGALARWEDVRRTVGGYVFNAMYQQRPSPARGTIFDTGWWRYWTTNESRATVDGRVRYLDPSSLTGGRWLDSWDAAFGETTATSASFVVGQRWVRQGADRFLVAQQRGRWSFTQTLDRMRAWQGSGAGAGLVHQRLVEKKANGAAIIDVLRREIPGIKPISPTASKEARARAVTPEIESGNVYLPHPADPGHEWVSDALSELREFPSGAHDDVPDALTQALLELREAGRGLVSVPGRMERPGEPGGWRVPGAVGPGPRRRVL